ncbi:hypothetical protein SDC9_104962 [bioreactor metagenome]|uniref:Uncharacterized protein n=1 Tax=bioreactor metagenome TaxID=1076179 RepID=A0A645B4Q0_9ZZZZ
MAAGRHDFLLTVHMGHFVRDDVHVPITAEQSLQIVLDCIGLHTPRCHLMQLGHVCLVGMFVDQGDQDIRIFLEMSGQFLRGGHTGESCSHNHNILFTHLAVSFLSMFSASLRLITYLK